MSKVVHVTPIERGASKETLSYYTGLSVEPGSIVNVSIRRKRIPALVREISPIKDLRSDLRKSSFLLKKLGGSPKIIFRKEFIDTCIETASYFATTVGALLYALSPQAILENIDKIDNLRARQNTGNIHGETQVFQAPELDRFSQYRNVIRQGFARKHSVILVVPTIELAHQASVALSRGIEEYSHTLHSKLPKKKIIETWNRIAKESHPVFVIMTSSFVGIPRFDIETIIIEHEGSEHYKFPVRPYVDSRIFIERYAKKIGATVILGDSLLRTETMWRHKEESIHEYMPLVGRHYDGATCKILDMTSYDRFLLFSPEVESTIERVAEKSEHMFLFAARKGLAPVTVCLDCGAVVKSKDGSMPMVLHATKDGNCFVSPKTGEVRDADELCKECNSWRLRPLGIGTELVEKDLREMFPAVKIFRLDKENAPTPLKARKIISQFYEAAGAVLVGTEYALQYIEEPVDHTAVISLDSLFAIPDFRIQEKIFRLLITLRQKASRTTLIQSRNTDQRVLSFAERGNSTDFYRQEIEERRGFNFPPFSIFIKVSRIGKKETIEREMQELANFLKPYETHVFPAFVPYVRGHYHMHALTRVSKDAWPDETLLKKLHLLPPYFAISVDPQSIL